MNNRPADTMTNLSDYLWWLLPEFLKRKDRAASRIARFCEVWGEHLDEAKSTLVSIIPELLAATARGAYLDLLARQRQVYRGVGESDDSLRARVLAAHILKRKGGTIPGMIDGLARLGFTVEVFEPYRGTPMWARFQLRIVAWDGLVDFRVFPQTVRDWKPAHTRAILDNLLNPGHWDDGGDLDDGGFLDDVFPTM